MGVRPDEVDVSAQREAHDEAVRHLSEVLADLAAEAKSLSRTASRGKPVDLTSIYALMQSVRSSEERCDLAALDIQTALGEDA